MRNLYYIIIALFLFLIMIVPQIVFAEENNWELKIKLDKQEYLLHEKIWLDATITNISSDSLSTNGFVFPSQFVVELKDESGNILKYTGPESIYGTVLGELIEPE